MIVYNTVSKLSTKTVGALQGLLMTQLSISQIENLLANITLNVTTKNMSRYHTMEQLALKNVEDLDGLNIEVIEAYPGIDAGIVLVVTAPVSTNHNTWQRLTDRLRKWGDIDGLLFNVLEISARSFTANKTNLKIIKPGKNYTATLKLIRKYSVDIKLLNKYNSQIKE